MAHENGSDSYQNSNQPDEKSAELNKLGEELWHDHGVHWGIVDKSKKEILEALLSMCRITAEKRAENTRLKQALELARNELGNIGTGLDPRTKHKVDGFGDEEFVKPFRNMREICKYAYEVRDEIEKILGGGNV